jgi:hypothetical protein
VAKVIEMEMVESETPAGPALLGLPDLRAQGGHRPTGSPPVIDFPVGRAAQTGITPTLLWVGAR